MKMKRSFWQQWKEAEPGMRDKMCLTMNAIAENEYFVTGDGGCFFGQK